MLNTVSLIFSLSLVFQINFYSHEKHDGSMKGNLYLGDLASVNPEKRYLNEFGIDVIVTCSTVSQSVQKESKNFVFFFLKPKNYYICRIV